MVSGLVRLGFLVGLDWGEGWGKIRPERG